MSWSPHLRKGHTAGMADKDWVEDATLTREETLRRFEALGPEPTSGPSPVPSSQALTWQDGRPRPSLVNQTPKPAKLSRVRDAVPPQPGGDVDVAHATLVPVP